MPVLDIMMGRFVETRSPKPMEIVETRTRLVRQAQAHMKTQQAYLEQSEDQTPYSVREEHMRTQVQVRPTCPTGLASMCRSAYATYAHGTPPPSEGN